MLHHVNINDTAIEVKRVLKRGGICAATESLKYNPVINVYRYMASEVRTEDEHPLSCKDINNFKSIFNTVQINFFG